jgi:beta-1,4-N-acetylglucosaminyltransferase
MSLFITVGSTGFDDLITQVTSQAFLTSLAALDIKTIRIQYGSSQPIFIKNIQSYDGPRIDITGYKYKPSITEDMENADIIISHAGKNQANLNALKSDISLIYEHIRLWNCFTSAKIA